MPDADFWHPAASRSVCAWRTWPQITHQAATTNCKTLGRDISRRRARRFRKGTKSRWSDIACSGGLSKQRRRGARSAPKSTRCKRHVTELGKRRSTTQPILAQPCFIETAARSAREALTTVASLGPRSKSVRTYETSENFTAFFCGKANSNGLEAAISPPVRPLICILTIRVT